MTTENLPISYRTVYSPGAAQIVEKKSRFIAHIAPVSSQEQAGAYIEDIKKKYWDARHNCHAYCVGVKNPVSRCSDDGEPSQTAGKPMLDVLQGAGLTNTCAVVTRYFGGILLGTGGLVRAYSSAVKAGLDACLIIEKRLCSRLTVDIDYTLLGKVQYMISGQDIMTVNIEYADRAKLDLLVPSQMRQGFDR